MTLTEATDRLWILNAPLIQQEDRVRIDRFFGAFTACARTAYASAYGEKVGNAARVWCRASVSEAYKECLRLWEEINKEAVK